MDPLSALGVASNILAVIDFGWTLLTEAQSIHKSSSGLGGEAEFVNQLIRDVVAIDEGLPSLVEVSEELKTLLVESKNITSSLQEALQALKARGNRSKWESFLSALKQTWGKEKVKDLTNKLASIQVQVTRHLQTATHKEVTKGMTAISLAIAQIESTNARLEIKRREDFQELQRSLAQAIEQSTKRGRDIALRIEGLVDERGISPMQRSKVLSNLAHFRKLEVVTRTISESAGIARADQQILDRLYFSSIQARHHKIQDAHASTFRWAFEQSTSGLRFREWLESRNGVFWVYGKPGSGKSTFMKFIYGSPDTTYCLRRWAGDKTLVVAKFFFWNAGTTLQKSQEGLLRSLLFEILRQCPELMPVVKSAMSEIPGGDQPDTLRYTRNLWLLYQRICTQEVPLKFCFFVDGLDEFEEDGHGHRDLIKSLRQLELSPDIKLCVSSRPWTVFVDEFGLNPEWTLKLENLTRDDIRRYVSDKFNEHPQFETLTSINKKYSQVVDAVVDRAQGVFLWVYLVVRTLLEGLTYHDSLSTLYQRLQEFPPDLEPFFQHLIDSVAPIYRTQMARYFKIATLADEPLPAMVYSYLDDIDDNPDFAIVLPPSELALKQIRLRHDQLRRRLDGRSRGLLELVQVEDNLPGLGTVRFRPGTTDFSKCKVDFLHRTVRDFLHQSADVASSLQHILGSENFALTACHAILAEIKTCPFHNWLGLDMRRLPYLVEELFFFISASLAENPGSETALESILEAAETSYKSTKSRIDNKLRPFLFIGLAAQIDFFAYVHAKLVAKPNMLQEARSDSNLAEVRPALDFALQTARCPRPISTRTVTYLLEAGADPNETVEVDSVWVRFLRQLYKDGIREREKTCELIRMLLLHGADLNATVYIEDTEGDHRYAMKHLLAESLINELLTPAVSYQIYREVRQISEISKSRWNSKKRKHKRRWYELLVRRSRK